MGARWHEWDKFMVEIAGGRCCSPAVAPACRKALTAAMSVLPPPPSPSAPSPASQAPSRWRALLERLRVAREEFETAAARSGQVPARLLRRLALLKLAIPLALLLGGVMLWVTERGYQRLDEVYAELKVSRVLSANLNTLSFLASRIGATQAEYLLERSP